MIDYQHRMQANFVKSLADKSARLFTTDLTRSGKLWEAYLASFPEGAERQVHNCNCCRSFIENYGGLVTVGEDGKATTPIWSVADAPHEYVAAAGRLRDLVSGATITGVFQSSEAVLGTPQSGGWEHFSVALPRELVHASHILTAGQRRAELKEDFGMVQRALTEFNETTARQALELLQAGDALYRSEKVLGVAKWFAELHKVRKNRNLVWRAVATAPAGFAHVRSSMIGTLLEDIQAGMSFASVSKRFADKMHPLQYQRPTAPPKAGSIAVAEKRMVDLGLTEAALNRRIARADEVPLLWRPAAPAPAAPGGGMFGHLAPGAAPARNLLADAPAVHMTLEKFVQTVVGTARKIEALVPYSFSPIYITTAVQDTGVKLFHWSHLFSWYVYHGGRSAQNVGLQPGYVEVTGITTLPSSWDGGSPHHGEGVIMLLAGARETHSGSICLFPEHMRGELREVRSVIEAYSRSKRMDVSQPNHAIGIDLRKGRMKPVTLRVDGRQYVLDRWE